MSQLTEHVRGYNTPPTLLVRVPLGGAKVGESLVAGELVEPMALQQREWRFLVT